MRDDETHHELCAPLAGNDFGRQLLGFHVQTPCRKRLFQREHRHRSYVHEIPWACLADGMWFGAAPGLAVDPGKTAPWLPPEVIAKQASWNQRARPRGGRKAAISFG